MSRRHRAIASAVSGVLGILTAGALAAPASAAGHTADLAVKASAGTIAAGATHKFLKMNIDNNSSVDAENFVLTLDISGLDQAKLQFDLAHATGENGPVCGQPEHATVSCHSQTGVIPAGIEYGWFFPLNAVPGASGNAGHIRATLTHDGGDPRSANNTADLAIRIGSHGPDMYVVADDAEKNFTIDPDGALDWSGSLAPGGVSTALYMIVNQGDTAITGMRITIRLPKGVHFTDANGPQAVGCGSPLNTCTVDRCAYLDHNRTAVCTYPDFTLLPASEDTTSDSHLSKQGFFHRITVDPGLAAPATLITGTVSVEPLIGHPVRDVDPTDNIDGMHVIVA